MMMMIIVMIMVNSTNMTSIITNPMSIHATQVQYMNIDHHYHHHKFINIHIINNIIAIIITVITIIIIVSTITIVFIIIFWFLTTFCSSTAARYSSRVRTTSRWPFQLAMMRAVYPVYYNNEEMRHENKNEKLIS